MLLVYIFVAHCVGMLHHYRIATIIIIMHLGLYAVCKRSRFWERNLLLGLMHHPLTQ